MNVEGSATSARVTEPDGAGLLAHTNHYVHPDMVSFEGDPELPAAEQPTPRPASLKALAILSILFWVGAILMQHLEGAPWHYLAIIRYASWQDFAAEKIKTVPASMKKDSGWFQFRDNLALHADTLCSRIQ